MIKKVINYNRLPKQDYLKPTMEVVELNQQCCILTGSIKGLNTTGLENDLTLDENGDDVLKAW